MRRFFFTLLTVLLFSTAAQAATKYEINVGGVEVTSDNCNRITGGAITGGYGVYNPSTNTLTLYSMRIARTKQDEYGIHNRNCNGLTIIFNGTCDISTFDNCLKLERSTTLNAASGSNTEFSTSARICANLKSYNYYIKGSGSISLYSSTSGYEAIKGDGTGLTNVYFQGAEVEVNSRNRSAMSSFAAYFQSGADVIIRANGSTASVSDVKMTFSDGATILEPFGAYYSNNTVYDSSGSQITSKYIYITSDYGLQINATNFPDANFRAAMLALYPDGYLTTSELANLTTLDIANKDISNMKGIEKLTYLKKLYCNGNSFTSLHLNNYSLTYLNCSSNPQLIALFVVDCTDLDTLVCSNTGITALDVNNQTKLKRLVCYNTNLTELSVSLKPQLTYLDCMNCKSLTRLYCHNANLTNLLIMGNTALTAIHCFKNPNLSGIMGLASCTAITFLDCSDCALTDLSACNSMPNLVELSCANNKLTSLTLTSENSLTKVNAKNNTFLTTAQLTGNRALAWLNISGCTALETLDCSGNALTSLNLSGNTALTRLDCHDNKLTTLDVSRRPSLEHLNCYGNQLTSISVQGCSALADLYCGYNKLSSLNVQGCTSLQTVYCIANQITAAGMTSLISNLPSRPASSPGSLRCLTNVIENAGYTEDNVFEASHYAAARAKHWTAQRWNGKWEDIVFELGVRGDVNGDGTVNIADINAIIGMILDGRNTAAGDVNGDGTVNISDINAVISIIIDGPVTPGDSHEWVDLGLPSGTLWATMNVGASSPEDYGDYFAWGETSPKSVYNWSTYKWCNGSETTLTKYCTSSSLGTVDNLTELQPEDDAASVNWGSSWRMPTLAQLEELISECTWTWTTRNGVNGMLVTGPNGNSIFLPGAGAFADNEFGGDGLVGYYWSRTIFTSTPSHSYIMGVASERMLCGDAARWYGIVVRAVRVE